MMLAVLSDIHANHIALEAVLKEVKAARAEKLLLLGDYVGYFYQPALVLEMLTPWDKVMIKGNHEEALKEAIISQPGFVEKYGHGHKTAMQQLSPEQISYLTSLPEQVRADIGGRSFLLCHGSPENVNEYVYPDADKKTLDLYAQDYDFVLMGHTHHPFTYSNHRSGSILCNPGSVGQPRDYAMASWLLINTDNKSVIFRRTAFDRMACIEEIKKNDPDNHGLLHVMSRGYEK